MRRETRRRENSDNKKNILYIAGSVVAIGVIAFAITFVVYGNKMEEQSDIGAGKIAALVQEAEKESQAASTQMGKTVEESKNEISNTVSENSESNTTVNNTVENSNTIKTQQTNAATEKKETTNTTVTNNKETTNTVNNKKEETIKTENKVLTFIKPVEGEICKEYAKDNLIYSETLQEWTTHLGIDIKAEKTTVVKAAADGKVKSIKNDPRYGLSIIIEHQDGYETLYANLLTSEFVQVGEEVKQGQSIGTVGNTATFEIADEAHLHFEITKNGECIDPTGLIK